MQKKYQDLQKGISDAETMEETGQKQDRNAAESTQRKEKESKENKKKEEMFYYVGWKMSIF